MHRIRGEEHDGVQGLFCKCKCTLKHFKDDTAYDAVVWPYVNMWLVDLQPQTIYQM